MKTHKIRVQFIFEGTFDVVAQSRAEAEQIVQRDCGLCIGGSVHTSNDQRVKDWDFPKHSETKILSINPKNNVIMKVICPKCGGTNVSCEAMINPNDYKFLHFTDESFDYGWCDDCKMGYPLHDVDHTIAMIEEKYREFLSENECEPLYAFCQIRYKEGEPFLDTLIKLTNASEDEPNDNRIIYYCNGIEELKTLSTFISVDFTLTRIYQFSAKML